VSRLRSVAAVLLVAAAATRSLSAADPIGVLKSVTTPPFPTAGGNIAYLVRVIQEDGLTAAANVTLTENVPAQTTFVSAVQNATGAPTFTCSTPAVGATSGVTSCNTPNVPAGSPDATFTVTFHINANATGTIVNTVTVTTTTADTNLANNTQTLMSGFAFSADMSVVKTAPSATLIAGSNVAYTITVANAGPGDAQNVMLTDAVTFPFTFVSVSQSSGPAFNCTTPSVGSMGPVACTTINFPANASPAAVFQLVLKYDPNGGVPTNTAFVSASTSDPSLGNNMSTVASLLAFDSDLQMSKTGPLTATAGQPVTYFLTATNNGPSNATAPPITDTLPSTLTFESLTQTSPAPFPTASCTTPAVGSSGTITCYPLSPVTPGTTYSFRLVARVRSNVAAGSSVTNTASYTVLPDPTHGDSNPFNNTATVTSTVSALADLSVSKIAGAGTVNPGNNITYTVNVSNGGPSDAATVALSDVVPTGTTFVSAMQTAGPSFACSAPAVGATGTINCTIASLAAGASATFTFVVQNNTNNLGGTVISNTAQVSTATSESTLANNSSTANVTVTAAGLAVTKSASPNPVQAGTNITYSVTVSNVGTVGAHGVSLTDAIPANTTFVSEMQTGGPGFSCSTPAVGATGTVTCTNALLAAGASADFQIVVRVNPTTANGTVISNTANVSTTDTDPNLSNNSATANTTVAVTSDISVTKSGPPSVGLGGTITYTVSISNVGTSDAQTVTLTDVVPTGTTFVSETQSSGPAFACSAPAVGGTGTISCNIATLAAGATSTFSIVVSANAGAGSAITNTATGGSASADANPANNSSSATTTVAGPDLAVTKSDSPDPVTAGSNITYTVTVQNNGTSGANNVSLVDAIPANTTFVSETQTGGPTFTCSTPLVGTTGTINCTNALLNAATAATFQVVVQVTAGTPSGTIISNTATTSTTDAEANTTNNSATATTTVAAAPIADLTITKSDAPDPVTAGSNITYTITITNSGTSAAANVSLSDPLPANTTFVSFASPAGWTPSTPAVGSNGTVSATNASLAATASATFTLVVNVNSGTPAATTITNTATTSTSSTESSTANNSATATTTVTAVAPTLADLVVAKSDSPDPVTAGSNITYTITVTNSGAAAAANVSLTDAVPTNTTFVSFVAPAGWTPSTPSVGSGGTVSATNASLASGASASFTLVVNVNSATPGGTVITNSANAATTTAETSTANNSATATTTVATVTLTADLVVTKNANPSAVAPGGQITYTITTLNNGPGAASGVSITDPLPAGTTLVSATSSQGSCSGTTTVICSLGSIANGASATVTIVITAPSSTGTLINSASANSTSFDAVGSNNTGTVAVAVLAFVPALDPRLLLLLVLALAAIGYFTRSS